MLIEKQGERVYIKQTIQRLSDRVFDLYDVDPDILTHCDASMFSSVFSSDNVPIYGDTGFTVAHILFSRMFGKWEIGITTNNKSIVVCYPSGAVKFTHHFNIAADNKYQIVISPCHVALSLMNDSLVKESVIIPIRDISLIRSGYKSSFFVPTSMGTALVEARFIRDNQRDEVEISATYRDHAIFSSIWDLPCLKNSNSSASYELSADRHLLLEHNPVENDLVKNAPVRTGEEWKYLIKSLDDLETFLAIHVSPYALTPNNRKTLLVEIHDVIAKLRAGPMVARVYTTVSEEISFTAKSLKRREFTKPIITHTPELADMTILNEEVKPLEAPAGFKIIDNSRSIMQEPKTTDPAAYNPATGAIELDTPGEAKPEQHGFIFKAFTLLRNRPSATIKK